MGLTASVLASYAHVQLTSARNMHAVTHLKPVPIGNVIVKGFPTAKATARLLARSGKAPNPQREMFTDEVFEDNVSAMEYLRIAKGVASEQTLTVVSFNTYYSRIADKTKKDVINPDVTFKAAFAMLEAGVDVLCMQEVVFGEDQESGGKDEYNFDFFGKAEFDAHGPAIENLKNKIKNMGYTFIDAAANPSTMYRKRFGNAVIVNTDKFEIVNQHVVPCLLGPEGNDQEARSAAMFHLKLKSNSSEVFVVNTHLTERQVGPNGARQTKMMTALVKQLSVFKGASTAPAIIAGDMNINQSQDLPNTMARVCEKSEYLSVKPENYPFAILKSNGFKSLQTIACEHDQVLSSCWNSAVVDYLGANGNLTPLFVGTLPPLYQGWRISDHSFPAAVYKL